MGERIRLVCAIILVMLAVGREAVNRLPGMPVPVISSHTQEAIALRQTLAMASASDRRRLGEVYMALAMAVETKRLIQNTEQLMAGTANALDLAFDGKKLVAGVDVGAQVDSVVEAAMGGRAAVSITDANRQQIVSGLREVAWACGR
jgi:hypothetical protein